MNCDNVTYSRVLQEIFEGLAAGKSGQVDGLLAQSSKAAKSWFEASVLVEPLFFVEDVGRRALPAASCPTIVLAVTEHGLGFIENCGCVVSQSGGMSRRNASLIARKRTNPHTIAIDLGRALPSPLGGSMPDMSPERVGLIWDLFRLGQYDCVVPDYIDWLQMPESLLNREPELLLSANVGIRGAIFPSGPVLSRAGTKNIWLFAITGHTWRTRWVLPANESRRRQDVFKLDAFDALVAQGILSIPTEDIVVLVGQIAPRLATDLAREIPGIDLVVTSNDRFLGRPEIQGTPRSDSRVVQIVDSEPLRTYGNTWIVTVSAGSYGISIIEIEPGQDGGVVGVQIQEEDLDSSLPKDSASEKAIADYYARVSLNEDWSPAPLFHDAGLEGGGYVGSAACMPCHAVEHSTWRASRHGTAWNTLLSVQRDLVPECVQCHVVGMGEPSGYHRLENDIEGLKGVGCESCHGGGRLHSTSPGTEKMPRAGRDACLTCHDNKHSSEFNFDRYWSAIKH